MVEGKAQQARTWKTGVADDAYVAITKGVEKPAQVIVTGPSKGAAIPARRRSHSREGRGCRRQATKPAAGNGNPRLPLRSRDRTFAHFQALQAWAAPGVSRRWMTCRCPLRAMTILALTGASGSGKSTMMNVLGCLDTPTSGQLHAGRRGQVAGLDDEQLASVRNRKIGFVFQNFYLMPRMTALDNVAQPLIYRGIAPGEAPRPCRAVRWSRVGLGDRTLHRPNEMSGGQRQRVAVARAPGRSSGTAAGG